MNKCKKTIVTLLSAMMLSVGLAPAAFAGSDNGGTGGTGEGGPVACLISLGDLSLGLGLLLGSGAAQGEGSSCNSTGAGGPGGNA